MRSAPWRFPDSLPPNRRCAGSATVFAALALGRLALQLTSRAGSESARPPARFLDIAGELLQAACAVPAVELGQQLLPPVRRGASMFAGALLAALFESSTAFQARNQASQAGVHVVATDLAQLLVTGRPPCRCLRPPDCYAQSAQVDAGVSWRAAVAPCCSMFRYFVVFPALDVVRDTADSRHSPHDQGFRAGLSTAGESPPTPCRWSRSAGPSDVSTRSRARSATEQDMVEIALRPAGNVTSTCGAITEVAQGRVFQKIDGVGVHVAHRTWWRWSPISSRI